MPIDQQGKNALILAAKKGLELVEFRLKDLEREIMGLRKVFDHLLEDREPTVQEPQHREPTIQESQQKEPVQQEPVKHEPIPVQISEKTKPKKKKELKPEPFSPPKSQTLLNLEKIFPEIESGSMHIEIQQPKPHKAGIEPEIQLDGVELRFLKMISGQEESEHKLPVIAGQLNLPIARVRDVVTRLLGIGLLYSPNPNDSNAEFYIDQKGLEALAKKKLL